MKKINEVAKVGLRSALGTKALLIFIVLVVSVLLQQASSVSSALGSGSDWIIEGDCVRWNNSNGDIKICPHTLTRSGLVNAEITSHLPTAQDLTFAFGISEGLSVSKPQILANINHPNVVSNCTRVIVEVVNNGTPQNEEQAVCNTYVADNFYNDWQNAGGFSQTTYNGRNWYLRNANWNSRETKKARVWVDVVPRSGKNKYHVFFKKASDTMAQATSSGNYVLLDPWVDSPPTVFNETFDNGEFVNASLTSLNISRGWLILNITGANTTNILLNASAVDGQNCWNSSADPAYSGTNYNCANLVQGDISDPFNTAQVWAANNNAVPQWIAYELQDTFWLYNFSYYMGFEQTGRNPANWSVQVSDTAINRSNPSGPGSDSAANWVYAQLNKTNSQGNAPSADGLVFGPVRAKYIRWHIANQNSPGSQIYITETYAYRSTFNSSGQMTSRILNDTTVVNKVLVTCINATGNSNEVGMNITVMDKNYQNEQTVQCNSDTENGFENDIVDITGLIYRINFSSRHSGVTPELDFLTIRVVEGGGLAAGEEGGDIAIEKAINTTVPSATKYKTQKVYVVNASNNQWQGTVDYLVVQNSPPKRWLLNYITAGESYLNASNLSSTVYILELANKTQVQVRDEMKSMLNATKS